MAIDTGWRETSTGYRRSYGDGWTATIDAGAHGQVGKWACSLWKDGEHFKQWERTVEGGQRYCDDLHNGQTQGVREAELAALREFFHASLAVERQTNELRTTSHSDSQWSQEMRAVSSRLCAARFAVFAAQGAK